MLYSTMTDAQKVMENQLREIGKELELLQTKFLSIRKQAKNGILDVMNKRDAKKVEDIRKQLGLK